MRVGRADKAACSDARVDRARELGVLDLTHRFAWEVRQTSTRPRRLHAAAVHPQLFIRSTSVCASTRITSWSLTKPYRRSGSACSRASRPPPGGRPRKARMRLASITVKVDQAVAIIADRRRHSLIRLDRLKPQTVVGQPTLGQVNDKGFQLRTAQRAQNWIVQCCLLAPGKPSSRREHIQSLLAPDQANLQIGREATRDPQPTAGRAT